jgi:hypothetical protein
VSEFTGEGFAPFPNTYEDNKRIGACSTLSDQILEDKCKEYVLFVQRKDIMPRAVSIAGRILDHVMFELAFRDGIYDEYTIKQEEELCDGSY